ncbi:hypothetical protein [Desulfonatronum thiodismutans]|uniref:hypothetical protein n=1 Tax=Desulfonatronum thiodismutans TaxID=159290 RepID=UPI0004ABE26B|nr:hypothetical protein [Desulfonatronum thiodismutans]
MISTTISSTIPHEQFVGNLLKQLEKRGWRLPINADGFDFVQCLERLLAQILSGCPADRHVGLRPLPDWLVNTFRSDGDKEPLKSFLDHSEVWHDILDSMALWLDYDHLQAAPSDEIWEVFDQRRSVLNENSFFRFLAGKEYVFREENPIFQRRSDFITMPLRHRLAMAGTFFLENFGTNAHREACFELLQSNKKTSKIPDAFLRLHEEACTDSLKTHVVVVSGDTTLFFSLHDFFHDPRKSAWQDGFPCLDNNSVQELIEYFRATFIKGNAVTCPASHFRHETLMQPGFVKSLAMIYWRNKLRDHLAQRERNTRNRLRTKLLADDNQAGCQPQTYHSRLVLEKIPLNAKVSLEFVSESGPSTPGIVCRMGGLKDSYLLLTVPPSEQARCEEATRETLVFRFSIPHKHQDQRFYACTCSLRHVKPVSKSTTALVVEPIQDVFPLDRKHPRVAADLLPMQSAHIHLGLAGLPENMETLTESGEPVALYTGISSSTWLEDISAGGACLAVSLISLRETVMAVHASGRSPSGVLHFRRTSGKRNSSDVLLAFQLVTLRQGQDALRAGLQFQAEAVRSKSGKLSWWPIHDLGCHELSRIIFAALLRRRDAF